MSTFGKAFRVTTYGESHCRAVGCIVDGCPPGISITTPRNEKYRVVIQSGTEFGVTLGTPIGLIALNEDQRPKDYGNKPMDLYPRPSHADWTYLEKYGVKASSGSGRCSARETIERVAAGSIAEKSLKLSYGVEITAFVTSVGAVHMFPPTPEFPTPSQTPAFMHLLQAIDRAAADKFLPVRCPDKQASRKMEEYIAEFRDAHDSIGGQGLGEPCFDKLEAELAHAMLSIPATKGFQIGSGFGGCEVPGSIHNDPFIRAPDTPPPPQLQITTNNSGGIQGGISNGTPIYFRVAFKPPATISQEQTTATYDSESEGILAAKGRHDPCVVPRAVPSHEARRHLPPLQQTVAPAENGVSMETSQIAKYQRKMIVNNKKGTGGIVFGIYNEKC
ncbi:chorismate synthase [Ustulina deusta]|nr:chorismate synthase [Ustulina deusta]